MQMVADVWLLIIKYIYIVRFRLKNMDFFVNFNFFYFSILNFISKLSFFVVFTYMNRIDFCVKIFLLYILFYFIITISSTFLL